MKKVFWTIFLLGGFSAETALAQYYNNGAYYNQAYYNQASGGLQQALTGQQYAGTTYYAPPSQIKKKPRDYNHITIGADYVLGYASYKTTDFVLDSALTGGQPYVSDTRDLDRTLNSLSVNIGWRLSRYFGLEAFYSTSLDDEKITYTESYTHYPEFARGEYTVSYKVYGLDLLGYVPINDYIEFIAAIGVGKYDAEAKIKVVAYEDTSYNDLKSTNKTFSDTAMAYRIGLGGQIWLSKHLTFRAMVRWTQIGGDFMDYITEVNAGVRYHF